MGILKRAVVVMFLLFLSTNCFADGYPLGPEDVLEISVWRDEALTKQVIVRPDGFISFPLIGDIDVNGKSVDQLRVVIQDKIV